MDGEGPVQPLDRDRAAARGRSRARAVGTTRRPRPKRPRELNERFVAARRGRSGAGRRGRADRPRLRRLTTLRALDEEAGTCSGRAPSGWCPYVDYMGVRTFDSWVHEQDIRRAVGRTGRPRRARGADHARPDGGVDAVRPRPARRRTRRARRSRSRSPAGSRARSSSVVALDDDGPPRASATAVIDGRPTAALQMDEETFVRRACGRITAAAALGAPDDGARRRRGAGHVVRRADGGHGLTRGASEPRSAGPRQ